MSRTERYFDRLRTIESVTKRYRTLAKRHHPDVGGNSDVMGAINDQYREALRRIAVSQARREAETSKAGQGMPNGGKMHHGPKERGGFSGGAADYGAEAKKGAEHYTSLESDRERVISEREVLAADAFQRATEDLIRAGARLFGEIAASWIGDKTKSR